MANSVFLKKCENAMLEKNSKLCIGLDPSSIFFREEKAARKYFEKKSEKEGMKEFCLDMIAKTAEYAAAFKLNAQFAFPFGIEILQELNREIERRKCISIYDLKLSDIGTSNESAIYWMKKAGFDAFTFSPFAGNIEEAARQAHEKGMGIIVLTLMSNPEARFFMGGGTVEGKKGCEWIAEQVKKFGCDGVVVGATNEENDIRKIRETIGNEKLMLVPGIGAQGGEIERVLGSAGENLLINVGRSVIYDEEPKEKARFYRNEFNK